MENTEIKKNLQPPAVRAGGAPEAAGGPDNTTGRKRSRLVTITAVLAMLTGGLFSFSFARANFNLISMLGSPSFQLSLLHATVPAEMPPAAVFLVRHMRAFFLLSLAFWLLVTALGIGVFQRRRWGRDGFRGLLYFGAAVLFLLLLYPGLVVPGPIFYRELPVFPEFNRTVELLKLWLQAFCAAGTTLLFWLARKFETEEIRKEFYR